MIIKAIGSIDGIKVKDFKSYLAAVRWMNKIQRDGTTDYKSLKIERL